MQEAAGVELAAFPQGSPELQAALETGVDGQRFGRGHGAVGLHRGVIQLAVGGMTRAGIVVGRTALRRDLPDAPPGAAAALDQLVQQCRQGGAHDSGAHQHGIEAASALKEPSCCTEKG